MTSNPDTFFEARNLTQDEYRRSEVYRSRQHHHVYATYPMYKDQRCRFCELPRESWHHDRQVS